MKKLKTTTNCQEIPTIDMLARKILKNREVDPTDLDKIGFIIINSIGEENIYFKSVLTNTGHFSKCLSGNFAVSIN
jgi:hypothetical protein